MKAAVLLLLLAVPRSETIEQSMARWCGEERHPRYTENERLICSAAYLEGAYQSQRVISNEPNTNDPVIHGDGPTCTVTVGQPVIECPEEKK